MNVLSRLLHTLLDGDAEARAARINAVTITRNRTVEASLRAQDAIQCARRSERVLEDVANLIAGRRPNGAHD